jgi:hypothetical protein
MPSTLTTDVQAALTSAPSLATPGAAAEAWVGQQLQDLLGCWWRQLRVEQAGTAGRDRCIWRDQRPGQADEAGREQRGVCAVARPPDHRVYREAGGRHLWGRRPPRPASAPLRARQQRPRSCGRGELRNCSPRTTAWLAPLGPLTERAPPRRAPHHATNQARSCPTAQRRPPARQMLTPSSAKPPIDIHPRRFPQSNCTSNTVEAYKQRQPR